MKIPKPPVHPLSALVTIALDGLWGALEISLTATVAGIPLLFVLLPIIFIITFIAVTLVQKHLEGDDWAPAATKGIVMGILAAVPYPFTGTVAGTLLLVWAGAYRLNGGGWEIVEQ